MFQDSHPTGAFMCACSAILLSFALSACNAGTSTTVADNTDARMAEETLPAQENAQVTQQEPSETADVVPKRGPNDPIYVNLAEPVLDSNIQKAEKTKGGIGQYIRNEFASDPVIQLIPIAESHVKRKTSRIGSRAADVEVLSKVSLKEVIAINAKTGKPAKMLNIVFEATISSKSPPATYTVSESGHIVKNMAVSKRFAKQIRDVIMEKIGPDMPAY